MRLLAVHNEFSPGRIGVPRLARLGLDLGEAHAGRRIGDADEMLAGRTLNLAAGELRFAFQRLVAV